MPSCGINYGRIGDGGGGHAYEYNLLPSMEDRFELSHHLAHAYSVACQCLFDDGMIVVMDRMGETYRTMRGAMRDGDSTYMSDMTLDDGGIDAVQFVPLDIKERAMYGIYD